MLILYLNKRNRRLFSSFSFLVQKKKKKSNVCLSFDCYNWPKINYLNFFFFPTHPPPPPITDFLGFRIAACFVRSKHGSRSLIVNGAKFVKDRKTNETINWRCANFIRYKCKARAISRVVDGREMVKLSQAQHTHEVENATNALVKEEYYIFPWISTNWFWMTAQHNNWYGV